MTSNQLVSHRDPAIASSISFCCVLHKIHSAISQPRPVLKPYLQLFHGLNSLLVWFQRRVWSADGTVYDNITPCPIGAKKVGLMGAIFNSFKHLLAPPWQKSILCMHRLDVVLQRVRHRHDIGRCLRSSGEDVGAMRHGLMMHRTLNSLKYPINDNKF